MAGTVPYTVPTYESGSTQSHLGGRTETIRPASTQSKAFVAAMCKSEGENNTIPTEQELQVEREELLREACVKHAELARLAAMGQGFDR